MSKISKIKAAIAKKEIENGGRWCKLTMKKNGDVVTVERLGYGPMERPEWDAHMLIVNGEKLFGTEFSNLGQVAAWIAKRY